MTSKFPAAPPSTHPAADVLRTGRGPYATAYLPLPSAVENADEKHDSAVRAMARDLERTEVPGRVIERLRSAAAQVDHAAGGQVVVVANEHRAWVWPAAKGADAMRTYWSSLPRIAPLLAMHQAVVPRLVVIADRAGADINLVDGRVELDTKVSGDTEHIHRGKPGGWSQPRFQQRAENTWEQNARLVVDEVIQIFDDQQPYVVAVAGDERAVGFLVDHLPQRVAGKLIRLEHGGRGAGADLDHMHRELAAELAKRHAVMVDELEEEFWSSLANETAVEGVADTMTSLFEGLADTLLVRSDPDDARQAFHGEHAEEVAGRRETLETIGIDATAGPLVEVAVRAAVGTGCSVVFLDNEPRAPEAGIGALLRASGLRSWAE